MDDPNAGRRIGCHCWSTNAFSVASVEEAADLGIKWVRMGRALMIDLVATGPRKYDWAGAGEQAVDLALARGMSVMATIEGRWGHETLVNKAAWCSPIWEHLDDWCDFVAAAVEHYRGRINHWEILNEPPFFWWYPPPDGEAFPAANPQMKRAPLRHYVALLKATAKTIRACDPAATIIVGAGFSDGHFLRQLYEQGCGDCFDVASVHYLPCQHPDTFGKAHRQLRHVMAEFGDEKKPLWDTESGPGGAIIGLAVQTPAQYLGLYAVYRHCFAHQFGLERYFWFNPVPLGWDVEVGNIGIAVRNEKGALTEPYRAMGVLIDQVGDGALLGHERLSEEVHLYVFAGPRGPVSILWATAAAVVRIAGGAAAIDHLGRPEHLPGEFALTGKPYYIVADLRGGGLTVTSIGARETDRPCWPTKIPKADTPTHVSVRTAQPLALEDTRWADVALFASREQMTVARPADHFSAVPSPLPAELQLAHDDENLYLRAQIWDDAFDAQNPSALLQFSLRDSDPVVREWPYFLNGYGLFSLHMSKRGARFLRFDHLSSDAYPSGVLSEIPVAAKMIDGAMVVTAVIPWTVIGPCRPGNLQPFFATFTVSRCDELLDVPDDNDPADWSHNFVDPFIVSTPALQCWIEFA